MQDHTTLQAPEVNIPYGYCHCGCGQKTPIAKSTNRNRGYTKGEPFRFVQNHNSTYTHTLEQAFWKYCMPGLPDACWEWRGNFNLDGYGRIICAGKQYLAHRVSFEIHNAPIPDDNFVCHHCDNRRCINPSHLFVGSHIDNINDMVSKKRHVGATKSNSKLTEPDVKNIRQMGSKGISQRVIGEKYGISQGAVSRILSKETWKHTR